MGIIKYLYYDCVSDYPLTANSKKSKTISISEWEFEKYAILNGSFNGHVLSREGRTFYSSFHKVALEKGSKNEYLLGKDYEYAETSYKNSISFFMGMIATRIVALKEYDIIHMFHLNDKSIDYDSASGRRPDWFGIDSHGKAFLFESKGTASVGLNSKKMNSAKDQLNAISRVTDSSGYVMTYNAPNIRKHVVVSCFNDTKDKRWEIQDVDPKGDGSAKITYNYIEEYFKYYKVFISFIESLNLDYMFEEINGQAYRCVVFGGVRYGIHESIYEAFDTVKQKIKQACDAEKKKACDADKKKGDDEVEKEVLAKDGKCFCEETIKTLKEIKCQKYIENSSSFEDGIIVCNCEYRGEY